MTKNIEAGDWIRFYCAGELVIGQVEYTSKSTIGTRYLQTSEGEVSEDSVLEVRKKDSK